MFSIQTILHPTDFSEPSHFAFQFACSLASDYNASVVIVHVASTPVILGAQVILPGTEDCQERLEEELLRLQVPDERVGVIRRLEEGNPATEILHVAQLCAADLIVMGTHGRRWLNRLLMGSVSEEVVRKATCPVLTVRSPLPGNAASARGYREKYVLSSTTPGMRS
jgi:nucleotide-binding universal stress UspA family protein